MKMHIQDIKSFLRFKFNMPFITSPSDEIIEDDPVFWAMLFQFGRKRMEKGDDLAYLWKLNYRKYLKSSPWKELSERAKERAGYRCQLCYEINNLETHHRTYDRLGEELDSDLIVLCRDCHRKFHRVK